ncbi:hypothetical protein [Methylomonas sp. AM2-LC]|uniref:hypothetical protein n=1 Tax=Methylomonas sp. AM2-LC TaxID=3153301 RepID=UPI003267530A
MINKFLPFTAAYLPLLETLSDYKTTIQDFIEALDTCYCELMHLTHVTEVMLEHPFMLGNDAFKNRLQKLHDRIETFYEGIDEIKYELQSNPVLTLPLFNEQDAPPLSGVALIKWGYI